MENFDIDKAYKHATEITSKVVKSVGARGHLNKLYKIKKTKDNCTCHDFELRKKPNRCSLNVNHLESRILSALKTGALKKLERLSNFLLKCISNLVLASTVKSLILEIVSLPFFIELIKFL